MLESSKFLFGKINCRLISNLSSSITSFGPCDPGIFLPVLGSITPLLNEFNCINLGLYSMSPRTLLSTKSSKNLLPLAKLTSKNTPAVASSRKGRPLPPGVAVSTI